MSTLNFNLHPAQLEIFKAKERFKVVAAGRRFGKSYLSAITLLIKALEEQNEYGYDVSLKEVWYVAPTFQQAKDIMWNLLKTLGRDIIDRTIENTATLYLVNGRCIKLKGSDRPDTLRGAGLAYVVLDEFADMKPMVWEEILFPTLTDVKGSALFIGTPKGKNHFFDLWSEALNGSDADWRAWHFNSTDNPVLDTELIEKAKGRLSSHSFRQEFEASFETAGGGIFKEEYFQFSDEEPADGQFFIAVDLAGFADVQQALKSKLKRLDETAIAVVKVHQGGWWVKKIDHGRWGIRETSLRILKAAKDCHASCVGIEQGALKNAIMPYLQDQMLRLNTFPRIETCTHGGQKKVDRITWALSGRFENGRITFNSGDWNKELIGQLLDFPNPMAHDDLADALAYIDQIAITNYANYSGLEEYWTPLDEIAGF